MMNCTEARRCMTADLDLTIENIMHIISAAFRCMVIYGVLSIFGFKANCFQWSDYHYLLTFVEVTSPWAIMSKYYKVSKVLAAKISKQSSAPKPATNDITSHNAESQNLKVELILFTASINFVMLEFWIH